MNRHTKVALFVAPVLILLGYVLSDLYMENEASKTKIVELVPFGHCDVKNQKCVLKSGEFEVNVMHENGITTVNSTYPLDTATLFLVDKQSKASSYPLGMKDSPYYWKRETPLGSFVSEKGASYKLRLIIEIKGGKYFAEFYTQTTK
jgi:hypothetical protein